MATKLVEMAKQMGARAFSRCLGKDTYDVLLDERLSTELTALWDCETLEDLQAYITASTSAPLENGRDRQENLAQRAFLMAAQACGPVSNEALADARWLPQGHEI